MADELAGCFSGFNFNIFKGKNKSPNCNQVAEKETEHIGNAGIVDGPILSCCCGSQDDIGSSDKPPAYSAAEFEDIYRPDVLDTIESTVDAANDALRKLSLEIHDHPELKFQEMHAHNVLTDFMESHGFSVTRHYLKLDTAWRADFTHGNSGRVIGVNSEMDALPGIGHACGHNLIAICGVGVALAIKAALIKHNISGKVVLLGTPAEEGGAGKVILLNRGGYKDMDACVMSHPGPGPLNSTGLGSSLATRRLDVEYFGHTAHAAAAPWEGQNALDAAFLAYSAVSVLRQQIKPDHRVHGIIEGKDWAANIIPDYAGMHWVVRAPSAEEAAVLRTRVKACIEAAATASDCRLKIDESSIPAYDLRQNAALSQNYAGVMSQKYDTLITPSSGSIGGSTDFGNISYAIPSIHPMFSIPTEPNGGNHTALFAASARTKEAHKQTLLVTKALAHTGLRVLDDDEFCAQVKRDFQKNVLTLGVVSS